MSGTKFGVIEGIFYAAGMCFENAAGNAAEISRLKICVNEHTAAIRRIRAEFTECKKTLADKLGIQSDAFFWPWGHYSDTGIKAAVQEDYKMLFTMDKNSVTSETPMTCIPRIAAPETLARFKKQEKIFSSAILKKIRKAFMRIKPS